MIEYSHNKNNTLMYLEGLLPIEGTVIVDTPTKEFLTQLFITHSNKTMFNAGLSIKSKKDQFDRKKGRELAEKRLTPILFELMGISQSGTKHIYEFYTNDLKVGDKNYNVHINLTTVAESDKVKLISSYINEGSRL